MKQRWRACWWAATVALAIVTGLQREWVPFAVLMVMAALWGAQFVAEAIRD